ncbi:hypothetical protein Ddye_021276 [Dipteronia dyeriana]|uniref:F-box domain-containing protein n=1 Tax=Dipteronia dyeriana TaxID=168575 RepID=A0AAD9WWR9_9ROSI|nr:hypothetical protein Ddye_021276 [Dipteronia dyeriana]
MDNHSNSTKNAVSFCLLPSDLIHNILLYLALPEIMIRKTVKEIPPSPLGPRGTSSWRRSGMKLVAEPDRFRFLFAELVDDRPVLFEYSSEADIWRSMEAKENTGNLPCGNEGEGDCIFLNVTNRPNGSVVVALGSQSNNAPPVIIRPRIDVGGNNNDDRQQVAVGFSNWGSSTDRQHVYGDGHMVIIRSTGVDDESSSEARSERKLRSIEVWGLSRNGENWEYISRVPSDLMQKISKDYGVMMGCLEKADWVIKIVLMSNNECLWQIFWLSYDMETNSWTWIPLPDCNMNGLNMAGIAFSRGLTLS